MRKFVIAMFLLLAGSLAQAQFLNNTQVSGADTAVTITWNSASPTEGYVRFGVTSLYGKATHHESTYSTSHTATITGLTSGVTYHFSIVGVDTLREAVHSPDFTSTQTAVAISISPLSANLQPGLTQQFMATVTGTTNTGVSWSANVGTISSNGLYTAPNVTSPASYTVTVTSLADATKNAFATGTVSPTPVAHHVTLNWTASTTPSVTYNVYRSTVQGGGYDLVTSSVSGTTYTDSTVSSGVIYYYVVRAFDGTSQSTASNEVRAVIPTP